MRGISSFSGSLQCFAAIFGEIRESLKGPEQTPHMQGQNAESGIKAGTVPGSAGGDVTEIIEDSLRS